MKSPVGRRATNRRHRSIRLGTVALLFMVGFGLASVWSVFDSLPRASANVTCLNSNGVFTQCPAGGSATTPASLPASTPATAPATTVPAPPPTGPTTHLTSDGISPVHNVAGVGYVVLAIGLLLALGVALARRFQSMSPRGRTNVSSLLRRSH